MFKNLSTTYASPTQDLDVKWNFQKFPHKFPFEEKEGERERERSVQSSGDDESSAE